MINSVIDWPLFYVTDQLLLFYWSSFDLNDLWLLLLQIWSRTESPSSAGASRTRTRRCPVWLWWPGLTYSWPHQQTLPGRRPVFLIKTVRCYWGVGDTVRGGANIQEMRGYWTLYVQKIGQSWEMGCGEIWTNYVPCSLEGKYLLSKGDSVVGYFVFVRNMGPFF
jgi:hypothetical protein